MDEMMNLVLEAVHDVGADQENEALINATEDTRLFGRHLNSLGIVFLVADLEARIADCFGVDVTLADDRAMSQRTSPFRSVQTLASYAYLLVSEARGAK